MPKIVLIRHAHSTANAAGVLSGQLPDVHLSKSGQEQAGRLAERLGKLTISQVQLSPMDRCSETLAPWLAKYGKGVTVISEPNLVEVNYGKWSGKKLATLSRAKLWRKVQGQPSSVTFPDGESLAQMQVRAMQSVHDFFASDLELTIMVSHGDVIKAIVASSMGMHLDDFQRIVIDPASITILESSGGAIRLTRLNDSDSSVSELLQSKSKRGHLLGGGKGITK
ncbi:MAG: MSMEG_4193 family putative phosphomutase [Actinobacteria bacterium]|nr:MSMEG_4193 family putative phosphomutase [Actinomycetota bacterium]